MASKCLSWALRLGVAVSVVLGGSARADEPTPDRSWCAPELTALSESMCFYAPDATPGEAKPHARTLVLFLHSLVGVDSPWAWQQQRLVQRTADAHGFSALVPRGRPGLGPGRDPKVLAWPTARALQDEHEDALLAEWLSARKQVEKDVGRFERVFVFGFSNGAYFATSLALRGKLDVDGYGVFAGGNGGKYHRLLAKAAPRRVPIFVGYGTRDADHPRQERLIRLLSELEWPHAARAERIGHTVGDGQLREALAFLTASGRAKDEGAP